MDDPLTSTVHINDPQPWLPFDLETLVELKISATSESKEKKLLLFHKQNKYYNNIPFCSLKIRVLQTTFTPPPTFQFVFIFWKLLWLFKKDFCSSCFSIFFIPFNTFKNFLSLSLWTLLNTFYWVCQLLRHLKPSSFLGQFWSTYLLFHLQKCRLYLERKIIPM